MTLVMEYSANLESWVATLFDDDGELIDTTSDVAPEVVGVWVQSVLADE